jgi:hypothetical protein
LIRQALAAGAAFLALSACQAESEEPGVAAGAATFSDGASAQAEVPSPSPTRASFAIRGDRDQADLIAGCQGMNPEPRPRGSNCFGIFPEQCGADQAATFLSEILTPDARARIEAIAAPGGTRFIRPGEAVIQDLRPGRLNIELDAQGIVERIDCY